MSTITQRVIDNLRSQHVPVRTRREWGSVYGDLYAERRRTKPALIPCDTVVQHITVTNPFRFSFDANMRLLEQIGYERFQTGISYNFVVNMTTGVVGMGAPLDAKGAHTINDKGVPGYSYDQNYYARAIAVLGMPDTPLSPLARRSIVRIMVALVEEGVLRDENFDYVPHSLFADKDCPCDNTRERMTGMFERARRVLVQRRHPGPR